MIRIIRHFIAAYILYDACTLDTILLKCQYSNYIRRWKSQLTVSPLLTVGVNEFVWLKMPGFLQIVFSLFVVISTAGASSFRPCNFLYMVKKNDTRTRELMCIIRFCGRVRKNELSIKSKKMGRRR